MIAVSPTRLVSGCGPSDFWRRGAEVPAGRRIAVSLCHGGAAIPSRAAGRGAATSWLRSAERLRAPRQPCQEAPRRDEVPAGPPLPFARSAIAPQRLAGRDPRLSSSSRAVTRRRRSGVIALHRLQSHGAPQGGPAELRRRPGCRTLLSSDSRLIATPARHQDPKLAVSTRGSVRRRCPHVCSRRSRRPRSVPAPVRRTCRAFG
jgi:hypothetical protein